MKNFLSTSKESTFFRAGKIILINAILLAALLIIFTPTEKIDDYNLKFILAGAATGQSDGHLLLYSNTILGQILKRLTEIIPIVSWYELTQYIVLFISFCVIVYLIQKRNLGKTGNAIILILLVIFGYETYIKLTFTKTAGVACASGLFLLFFVLYDTNFKKSGLRKNVIKLIISVFLITIGAFLRFSMLELIFGIGMVYLLYRFACNCVDKKNGNNQIPFKNTSIFFVRTIAVSLVIFCCLYGLNQEGRSMFSQDQDWAAYMEYNPLKVNLQDYGWPDYDEYRTEYEELGIDEVMFNFWSNRDYSDPEYFTIEEMQDIIQIKQEIPVENGTDIISFFKEFPNRFFNEICFWAIIPLIIYWCVSKQRYKKITLIVVAAALMLLNFYQYMQGRFDQHQVNVGIWFVIALIFVSCMEEATKSFKHQSFAVPITGIYLMCFVCINYSYISSDNYYGASYNHSVSDELVKSFLELASNDNGHLYITNYDDRNYGFKGYSVFEQIPAGLYHNIYCTQDYMFPTSHVSLDNYGVYNVYREIVDSDVIFYYKSDDTSTAELKRMEAYIQDLYNDTAQSCLVKRFDGFSVYGFLSDDFQLDTGDIIDISSGEEDVVSCVALSIDINESEEDETLEVTTEVSGYIYKEDSNSFNQRVYLEIWDENGDIDYQVVTTYENDSTNDIMNGAYGQIYGSYTSELSDWDQNAAYNIILECDDGMYRLPLEVNVD